MTRRQLLHMTGAVCPGSGRGAKYYCPWPRQRPAKDAKDPALEHFVSAYETWFNETYVKEWGEKNNTKVMVDILG